MGGMNACCVTLMMKDEDEGSGANWNPASAFSGLPSPAPPFPVKYLPRPWPPRARAPRPQSAVEMGDTRTNKRRRTSSDSAPAAGKAASVSTLEHPSNAAGVSLQSTQVAVPGSAAHDGAPASTPPHGGAGAPGPHETEEALSNPPPARCVPV